MAVTAASEFSVLFLTRYGDVPPGYTGIIILPRPVAAVNASAVNAAAEVLLQQPPDFEAALRRALPPLSIPFRSAVNAAAEVLLQQPPDFEAALRRAPPPLSIPSRMGPDNLDPCELSPENLDPGELSPDNLDSGELSPENLDPGELSPDNLDPGDRRPISTTKGSARADLGGKRPISASNSDCGAKGSTSISTDPEGSSRKGLPYSNWENRTIKDYYVKSHENKCKKVDWQHLCDTELIGRTVRGVEGQLYKITHHDDLISSKRAAGKVKNLPPKSDGAEGTEEQGTARKTVQNRPLRNGAADTLVSKTAEEVQGCVTVDASEEETARRAQDLLPKNDGVEDAPPENKNGMVQDPSSSENDASEGSPENKTFKKVESGGEEDCQED